MWDICARNYLYTGIRQTAHEKELDAATMLKQVQKQVDTEQDKYFKRVKKK
jgi:hypothetical protein